MTTSDDKALHFYALIGEAITRWTLIERVLFSLCKFSLSAGDEKTAAVFYHSSAFNNRVDLTESLLRCALTLPRYREWRSIFCCIKALLPFRGFVAHNPLMHTTELSLGSGDINRWWSIQTENMLLHVRKKPSAIVKDKDLQQHIRDVMSLASRLQQFEQNLPKQPLKKPSKFVLQETLRSRELKEHQKNSRTRQIRTRRPRS
jgi:hypothetical protein